MGRMTISGLKRFVESFESCFYEINFCKFVSDCRQKRDGELVIAVNGGSFLLFLYSGLDWACGGQHKEYIERLKRFVDFFEIHGTRLVFFFSESSFDHDNIKNWIYESERHIQKLSKHFEDLQKNQTSIQTLSKEWEVPVGIRTFSRLYLKEICGCEVRQSKGECKTAILEYSRLNQHCVAILSRSIGTILYETPMRLLTVTYFDHHSIKVFQYDRVQFAKVLQIHPSQLPLFATLVGNHLVNRFSLREFHLSIERRYEGGACREGETARSRLFMNVAHFIRESSMPIGNAIFQRLPEISRDILKRPAASDQLKKSVEHYFPPFTPDSGKDCKHEPITEWAQIIHKSEDFHRHGVNYSLILLLLRSKPYKTMCCFEHNSYPDLFPADRIVLPLRRRLYGVLFYDSRVKYNVPEFYPEDSTKLKEHCVEPEPPQDEHPGLLTLWSENCHERATPIKWTLLAHAISKNLSPKDLRNLPGRLILPVSAFFYLKENLNDSLADWELNALISTIIVLPSISVEYLSRLSVKTVNMRACMIASVFLLTLWTVGALFGVCGYPSPPSNIFPHAFFDGKLFQRKYHDAKTGATLAALLGGEEEYFFHFNKIRRIISGCKPPASNS